MKSCQRIALAVVVLASVLVMGGCPVGSIQRNPMAPAFDARASTDEIILLTPTTLPADWEEDYWDLGLVVAEGGLAHNADQLLNTLKYQARKIGATHLVVSEDYFNVTLEAALTGRGTHNRTGQALRLRSEP